MCDPSNRCTGSFGPEPIRIGDPIDGLGGWEIGTDERGELMNARKSGDLAHGACNLAFLILLFFREVLCEIYREREGRGR